MPDNLTAEAVMSIFLFWLNTFTIEESDICIEVVAVTCYKFSSVYVFFSLLQVTIFG